MLNDILNLYFREEISEAGDETQLVDCLCNMLEAQNLICNSTNATYNPSSGKVETGGVEV